MKLNIAQIKQQMFMFDTDMVGSNRNMVQILPGCEHYRIIIIQLDYVIHRNYHSYIIHTYGYLRMNTQDALHP